MMRKFLVLLTILTLVVGFAACGGDEPETTGVQTEPSTEATTQPTEVTTVPTTVPPTVVMEDSFPEDLRIAGVDVGGMTEEEGLKALTDAAASYKLALTVNAKSVTVSGSEIGLAVDEAAYGAYVEALRNGTDSSADIVTYDRAALRSLLKKKLDVPGQNADISYSSAKNRFVADTGVNGVEYDADAAADGAAAAIEQLAASAKIKVSTKKVAPEITADNMKLQSALSSANGYLKVSLSYTYAPEGGETATEAIGTGTLASFVHISDDFEVSISRSAIENYASRMSDRHSGADYKGDFKTTGGGTVGFQVSYYGQRIDQAALASDIYKCVTEGTSGTRTAPYGKKSDMPYGGSYVEINLSSQHLWVYKDGERVVSTDLVSGSVAEDCCTPTGVYSIYAKQTDRYLSGEGYRSFVHYWMPFLGGYGLHDASWRSSFGGDIYLYDGSHGCVNLPSSAAKKVFNNVKVGTKVILYGGKREVDPLQQKITGTTHYEVTVDAAPFKLDAKAKYSGAELKYSSSDTSVVKVSKNGTVTVVGEGSATITVTAEAYEFYSGAELKVTIVVKSAGGETTPPTDPPTDPTDPPTDPTDPPTDPTDPPTEPTDPPTEPTDPPTEPTDPPTEPTDPPTEPTDPPTEPTEPPTEATDPTEETAP